MKKWPKKVHISLSLAFYTLHSSFCPEYELSQELKRPVFFVLTRKMLLQSCTDQSGSRLTPLWWGESDVERDGWLITPSHWRNIITRHLVDKESEKIQIRALCNHCSRGNLSLLLTFPCRPVASMTSGHWRKSSSEWAEEEDCAPPRCELSRHQMSVWAVCRTMSKPLNMSRFMCEAETFQLL